MLLVYIVVYTLLGSVFSLVGGILLLFREKLALRTSHFLASFAAGVLLAAAFFDLLPEALELEKASQKEHAEPVGLLVYVILGILLFFLLERFIYWFHHHHDHASHGKKPTVPLIVLGDSVHNFIDGMVIAGTFLVSVPVGIVTSLAVIAHEIPQEIGDFGLLLHKGLSRKKVLWINIISSLVAVTGALITFFAQQVVLSILPALLALTAGFFIYIALSDLIPEIHEENRRGFALVETMCLFIGVVVIWMAVSLLEG